MFKLIILLNKSEDMTEEQFAKYWLDIHSPLARNMPGLRKYTVNLVQHPPNWDPEYNGVVELWFDDRNSMKKAFASSEGQLTQKDSETFTSKMITLFIDEHVIT
jgi:uncharacterized protein (TIGR02118 family)